MNTNADVEAWALRSQERGRELQERLEGILARLPKAPSTGRVEVELDDAGLVGGLTYTGAGVADTRELQRLIVDALAVSRRVGSGMSLDAAERFAAEVLDGTGRTGEAASPGRTIVVRAEHGFVVDVRLAHALIGDVEPQALCDRIVPLARRAAIASDTAGRFPEGAQ